MKNIKEVTVLMCCLSLIFPAPIAFAAPQGGKVVGGSANIHQSGTTTTINQSSARAIINWHSFDIGKNEAVRHNMPSTKSAGLHRVVGGGGASQIQGLLQSNGNIYLVNPAGVVIHKGARVDTNSFIATTRDIADSNFMKGKMVFDRPDRPGAHIINQGAISVKESGLAALVAPTVRNEGLIAGKLGKVALASGDSTWKLDMHGDDLITFTVNENDVNALHAADGTPLAGVENSGSIKAEGGVVVLTAAQLDGIVGSVVNSGEVSAASAEFKGGKITFRGEGSHVDVRNTGIVDASSAKADGGVVRMVADGAVASSGAVAATGGQKGGKAVLTGRDVALTGTTKIDVSGNTGGGTALVGGNALGKGPERNARTAKMESGAVIHADAQFKGDGGQVVVWSDEKTTFDGAITAKGGREGGNGGMVETSGKSLKVGDTAWVNTSAPQGKVGQWLLDPVDFVVAASGGDITGTTISANLASTDVEIKTEQGKSGTNGDVIVNEAINWSSNFTLTLTAERNVAVNANITATGANAGLTITPKSGEFNLMNGKITLSGISPRLNIAGENYTVINSLQVLQDINNNLSGYFALGSDIDAKETKSWNNGEGFVPIGIDLSTNSDVGFCGKFFGLNNKITNLFMEYTGGNPTYENIGLFSSTRGTSVIRDLKVQNAYIKTSSTAGVLVGVHGIDYKTGNNITTLIQNCDSSGKIISGEAVGGLVGRNRGKIQYCSSNVNIIDLADATAGGLVGRNGGVITNSYASGDIRGVNIYAGGLVGVSDGTNYDFDTGRLVSNGLGIIKNSYSTGNVTGELSSNSIGGFIGGVLRDATIENCYSTGIAVNMTGKSGGFAGSTYGPISIINCYYDVESSKNSVGAHVSDLDYYGTKGPKKISLKSLTTSQMKQKLSFDGWDFTNIWTIAEGQSYPQFQINLNIPIPNPGTGGGTTDPGTGDTEQNGNSGSMEQPHPNINPIDKEEKNWLEKLIDFIFDWDKNDNTVPTENTEPQSDTATKQDSSQASETYKILDADLGGMLFDYSDEIEIGPESKDEMDTLISGLEKIFSKKGFTGMKSLMSLVQSTLGEMIDVNKMSKKMLGLVDNKLDEPINNQYWGILDGYKNNTKGMIHGNFLDGEKNVEYYIMMVPGITKNSYNFALFEITKTPKKGRLGKEKYTFKIVAGTEVRINNVK